MPKPYDPFKDFLSPLSHWQQQEQLEKMEARAKKKQEQIETILKGEMPKDPLSWEYYIWNSKDPLRIK